MTTAEKLIEQGMKLGMERGMERGMLTERREMIAEVLDERFHEAAYDINERINAITDPQSLKQLLRHAIRCESLDDFRQILANVKA